MTCMLCSLGLESLESATRRQTPRAARAKASQRLNEQASKQTKKQLDAQLRVTYGKHMANVAKRSHSFQALVQRHGHGRETAVRRGERLLSSERIGQDPQSLCSVYRFLHDTAQIAQLCAAAFQTPRSLLQCRLQR